MHLLCSKTTAKRLVNIVWDCSGKGAPFSLIPLKVSPLKSTQITQRMQVATATSSSISTGNNVTTHSAQTQQARPTPLSCIFYPSTSDSETGRDLRQRLLWSQAHHALCHPSYSPSSSSNSPSSSAFLWITWS